MFLDWDEDQSTGVQASGGETEDAAETRCRCWKSKNPHRKVKDILPGPATSVDGIFHHHYVNCVSDAVLEQVPVTAVTKVTSVKWQWP